MSVSVLLIAHSLLIRYPNVRHGLKALTPAGFAAAEDSDDMKSDMAMDVLR